MTLTKRVLNSRGRNDFSMHVHSGQVVFVASYLQMQWQQKTSPQHDTATGLSTVSLQMWQVTATLLSMNFSVWRVTSAL